MKEFFAVKKHRNLQKMNSHSDDIQSHNILTEYQRRPEYLDNLLSCRLCITTLNSLPCKTLEDPYDDRLMTIQLEHENLNIQDTVIVELSNGIILKKKNIAKNT